MEQKVTNLEMQWHYDNKTLLRQKLTHFEYKKDTDQILPRI